MGKDSLSPAGEGKKTETEREEVLIAIFVPIVIFLIILFYIKLFTGTPLKGISRIFVKLFTKLAFPSPPILSFVIFYIFSRNLKKSAAVGIIGLVLWTIIIFVLIWVEWVGLTP